MAKATKPPKENQAKPSAWGGADLGIHMMVCVVVGGALGYGADHLLHSKPWFTLLGVALGFGAWLQAMWRVFKAA